MASLPTRTTASFQAIQPIPSAAPLDAEFNQYVGAAGFLNGGSTATKLLIKSSDASDPPVEIDQVGAGPLAEWKQNGVLRASIDNDGDLSANGITGAAGVYTFGSIPVGPASNPSSDNQFARKAYVDARQTFWTANWTIQDPSTFPLNSFNQVQGARVGSANFRARWVSVVFLTGTASGSFTFDIRYKVFGAVGQVTIADEIAVNPGTVLIDVETDLGEISLPNNALLFPVLTSISSPLQRDVQISLKGWQTPL